MKITNVKIRKLLPNNFYKAIVSVTVDNCFAIHDIRVVRYPSTDTYHIRMPSETSVRNVTYDVVHPTNAETRREFEKAIVDKYLEYIETKAAEAEE